MSSVWLTRLKSVAAATAMLAVWQVVCATDWVSPLLLASPFAIARWLATCLFEPAVWSDLFASVLRVLIALLISTLIGIPTGMLLGRFRALEQLLRFPIDFGRSIPATALFPLFILFFGAREGSRVAAAIYGAALIILMNTMVGVRQANAMRMRAARAYGATGWKLYVYVLLPEALPAMIAGIRLGASLSLVIIVLVEMFVGTSSGLGHRIINSQIMYEIPEMYGTIIITGTLGYAINLVFVVIEQRFAHYVGH
ncbi:MAG: ABC transporter permease [Betaproteobacteria bacterium]